MKRVDRLKKDAPIGRLALSLIQGACRDLVSSDCAGRGGRCECFFERDIDFFRFFCYAFRTETDIRGVDVMKIAMTGVSGEMGREVLAFTLTLPFVSKVKVLFTKKKRNVSFARRLKRRYRDRLEAAFGNVSGKEDCARLIEGCDYVVHMAGVIPPLSDERPDLSEEVNLRGTMVMTDAVCEATPQPALIHISSVAVYGNRTMRHPFGRVGDPLLVSAFEAYDRDKLKAERYILDAPLERFVILRQTAMLHPRILQKNMSDSLMFRIVLDAPLEWVSARDTGRLFAHLFEREERGELGSFWNNVYNVGGGERGRASGYETLADGMSLIGRKPEAYFRPDWFLTRNFHGMWFADGDELERFFSFQRDGVRDYWREIGKKHPIYSLGRVVPAKLVYFCLLRRLLKQEGSPKRWIERGDKARLQAYFGGKEGVDSLPASWEETDLAAKRSDYAARKRGEGAALLSHGFDDSKPMSKWTIDDARSAARFRGGECLSANMSDVRDLLSWRCAEGHTFSASALTVMRAGHWCPICGYPDPWRYDALAKRNPFYAQVWYDSHGKEENYRYELHGEHAVMKEEKER